MITRKTVLVSTAVLVLLWLGLNFRRLSADEDILIRFVLGALFAALIVARPKPERGQGTTDHGPQTTAASAPDLTVNGATAARDHRLPTTDEMGQQSEHGGEPPSPDPLRGRDYGVPGKSVVGSRWSVVPSPTPAPPDSQTHTLLPAAGGALLMVLGIVFAVHQANWLGLLLVLYAALSWTLSRKYQRDIILGLFLLYWVHPVPSQMFGPMQIAMQQSSVAGSEWMLHCANVRVWADGMILRTGYRSFGVPESCSGMRTAVTVLMCSLGTALLFRLRWYEIVVAMPAGLVQVLFLNILRIFFMVMAAPRMPREWATTFLHDTAGLLLLAAVFLTQAEVAAWRAFRVGRRKKRPAAVVSTIPPILLLLKKVALIGAVALVFAAAVAGALYKKRPYHRAMMIKEVADVLAETDPATAERASRAALALQPENHDLIAQQVEILLLLRKFDGALGLLKKIPPSERTTFDIILKGWGLMSIGQPDNAIATVESLPEEDKSFPVVAMVRAELAATRDNVAAVVSNVTIAVESPLMLPRVRSLFSYLAARQQWKAIVACQVDVPYAQVDQALIAVHAHYQVNQLIGMARILKQSMDKWSGETGFIEYLAAMAMARPGSSWEELFADKLRSGLGTLSSDQLSVLIDGSFRITRPDLAWLAYNRLASLDPRHPALSLAAAEFGNAWFAFRRHHVGLPAQGEYETVDLARFYFARRGWAEAPRVREMTAADSAGTRMAAVRSCLDRFQRMERDHALSPWMKIAYPEALEMAGRREDAEKKRAELSGKGMQTDEAARILAEIDARLAARDLAGAWQLLQPAMGRWPTDLGFLRQLGAMAGESPKGAPGGRFTAMLTDRPAMNADQLAVYIEAAFLITRPDLAWSAYNQLKTANPDHPALDFMAAKFADVWFTFQKQAAGLDAAGPDDKADLKKLYLLSRDWPEAPLAAEMATADTALTRIGHLKACLEEIERRKAAGRVSVQIAMMYPAALGLAGRYAEARAALDAAAAAHPEKRGEALFKHAMFYSTECEWQKVYESVREYSAQMMQPKLAATIMQIDALIDAYQTVVNPEGDNRNIQDKGFKDLLPMAKELQQEIRAAGGE